MGADPRVQRCPITYRPINVNTEIGQCWLAWRERPTDPTSGRAAPGFGLSAFYGGERCRPAISPGDVGQGRGMWCGRQRMAGTPEGASTAAVPAATGWPRSGPALDVPLVKKAKVLCMDVAGPMHVATRESKVE